MFGDLKLKALNPESKEREEMENEERFDFENLRVYQKALEYVDRQVPHEPRPLGRGQGAQYKSKLPSREAPPFRAGSFILYTRLQRIFPRQKFFL